MPRGQFISIVYAKADFTAETPRVAEESMALVEYERRPRVDRILISGASGPIGARWCRRSSGQARRS